MNRPRRAVFRSVHDRISRLFIRARRTNEKSMNIGAGCHWRAALRWTVIGLILPVPAFAQMARTHNKTEFDKILANTQRLKVEVIWDKTRYFTREPASVTLRVTNPTGDTVEILKPFQQSTGTLEFSVNCRNPSSTNRPACFAGRENDGNYWGPLAPDDRIFVGNYWDAEIATILLHPTESLTATFEFPSQECTVVNGMTPCYFPAVKDLYQVRYTYSSGARAEFSITEPVIEAITQVLLPRQYEGRSADGGRFNDRSKSAGDWR